MELYVNHAETDFETFSGFETMVRFRRPYVVTVLDNTRLHGNVQKYPVLAGSERSWEA